MGEAKRRGSFEKRKNESIESLRETEEKRKLEYLKHEEELTLEEKAARNRARSFLAMSLGLLAST